MKVIVEENEHVAYWMEECNEDHAPQLLIMTWPIWVIVQAGGGFIAGIGWRRPGLSPHPYCRWLAVGIISIPDCDPDDPTDNPEWLVFFGWRLFRFQRKRLEVQHAVSER